ncbi:sensor histidine kinase [Carboxylicivirga sp. N1Y90]|uniref:sensor histidine kinase n=1 Tax=Carboxylicivirga fragile TaxID=3417571 RepID=UPI003D3410E2|nr:histidine kinase [Marinilabiliaceae bacterium N1Y90]
MAHTSFSKQITRFLLEVLLLALIGNGIVYFIMGFRDFTLVVVLKNILFSFIAGWPMLKSVTWMVKKLDAKVPWLRYPVRRLIIQSLGVVLLCAVFIVFTMLVVYVWHYNSEQLQWASFMQQVMMSLKIAFSFLVISSLISNSILFFGKWKDAAVEQEKLKHEHTALQYETLKSQVNPHFLFNSLNALIQLIHSDPYRAEAFVKKLSYLYRYVLEQKNNETVTLKEELDALKDYIFLLKIRYGDNLIVTISDALYQEGRVVPMSLQMLLENVVKHNVIAKKKPVNVKVWLEEDYIVISNTVNKKKEKEDSTGIGLENIRMRYRYFSSNPLIVREDEECFEVRIPLLSMLKEEENAEA